MHKRKNEGSTKDMPVLDNAIIGDILNSIAPFSITFAITFALAEGIFQWFMRVAFGRNLD